MTIPVYYRDEQSVQPGVFSSFSPSASKPALVMAAYPAEQVTRTSFYPVTRDELADVHSRDYVDGILDGRVANGFGNRSMEVAKSLLYTVGSFRAAARYAAAMRTIAHSPTSGFHHAGISSAAGFCTFSGVALAARDLSKTHPVGILDLDCHYGNGTAECLHLRHVRVGRFDIEEQASARHYPIRQVSRDWKTGAACLADLPEIMHNVFGHLRGVGVLLYQAGADSHVDDSIGPGYLTTEQMRQRDQIVFEWCVNNQVGCAWNLAGGYQRDAKGDPTPVVNLHVQTMNEAYKAVQR